MKQVHGKAEEARVALRNIRRSAIDELRKGMRAGEIPEDEERRSAEEIDQLTQQHNEKVDQITRAKERELMDV